MYPATFDTLEVQDSDTECETAGEAVCAPSPRSEIAAGELVALLATVTLPDKLPAATGANMTSSVADCPGARIRPAGIPLTEKRAPETETFDTLTLELPAFVRMMLITLLFPIVTFPKFKLDVLEVSNAVAAIPIPLKETMLGELETLLVTETLPDNAPATFGENTTSNVNCFPASIVRGNEMPLIATPAAVVLAFVTIRFDAPPFDIVTD